MSKRPNSPRKPLQLMKGIMKDDSSASTVVKASFMGEQALLYKEKEIVNGARIFNYFIKEAKDEHKVTVDKTSAVLKKLGVNSVEHITLELLSEKLIGHSDYESEEVECKPNDEERDSVDTFRSLIGFNFSDPNVIMKRINILNQMGCIGLGRHAARAFTRYTKTLSLDLSNVFGEILKSLIGFTNWTNFLSIAQDLLTFKANLIKNVTVNDEYKENDFKFITSKDGELHVLMFKFIFTFEVIKRGKFDVFNDDEQVIKVSRISAHCMVYQRFVNPRSEQFLETKLLRLSEKTEKQLSQVGWAGIRKEVRDFIDSLSRGGSRNEVSPNNNNGEEKTD